jgi:hypothetical protein
MSARASHTCYLQSEIANRKSSMRRWSFLRRRTGGTTSRGLRDLAWSFLLRGLPGCFSPLPLLVAAVVRLLVGRLFLHPSIMSQIAQPVSLLIWPPFDKLCRESPLLAQRTREKWGTRVLDPGLAGNFEEVDIPILAARGTGRMGHPEQRLSQSFYGYRGLA